MSDAVLLGHVPSNLGDIELHYSEGVFATSRTYVDALLPLTRESVIIQDPGSAHRWYEMCRLLGAVYAPFPATLQPPAATERTPS